jgi:PIN domain nuclease of toxin-antitoxin system
VRVLLDTATFLWAARTPEKVSRTALSTLGRTDSERQVSAVSITEIAIKHARGKLAFSRDDVLSALEDLLVNVLPYRSEHALRLFELPLHHADPFDRQIIAQAVAEDIPVITSDRAFRRYKELKLIW